MVQALELSGKRQKKYSALTLPGEGPDRGSPPDLKPCSPLGSSNEDAVTSVLKAQGNPSSLSREGPTWKGRALTSDALGAGGGGTYLDLPRVVGNDQAQEDDGGQTDKAFQGQRKHGVLWEKRKEN